MKAWLALALVACGSSVAKPQPRSPDALFRELSQQEHAWAAAYLAHDTVAIGAILADEFVGIDGRGVVTDKTTELRDSAAPAPGASPDFVIVDDQISDIKVRGYGDVAVLTAISNERVRIKGQEEPIRFRRTTVWLNRGGRWQCISFHGSRINDD